MKISINEITEKLNSGNYKIYNRNTGVSWLCNRPSTIKYCYKSGDYEVFEPETKTEPETKNDKKTKKE